MDIFKRRQHWHLAIVLSTMLAVPLLMAPLVYQQAKERANGEAVVTAAAVLKQLDTLLEVVDSNLGRAQSLLDKPCPAVLSQLTKMSTLSPYFRSVVLVRDGNIYCSPVLGSVDIPLHLGFNALQELPEGRRITPSPATSLVQDRPAVIISRHGEVTRSGVLAIVDGQYLLDIQKAASYNGKFEVQMVLRDTQMQLPSGASSPYRSKSRGLRDTAIVDSASFPVEVRVAVNSALARQYRGYLWRDYTPFLVLASLLAGHLAHLFCRRNLSLIGDLHRAIRDEEFYMAYQPVIRLETGECRGVEALVRWQRPDNSLIRPDIFIPLAEDNGMIGDLSRHIFGLVAADLQHLGFRDGDHIAVNVSGSHLATSQFVTDVSPLLTAIKANRLHLILEVTEREALPNDTQVQQNMEQLRRLGVQWALDDFGTGQSSLSYLEELQVDYLKIDRSFVNGVGSDSVNGVVLETIIELAQRLDLEMTAEGIESPEQERYLRDRQVQWGQGYLFSRPLNAAELRAWRDNRDAGKSGVSSSSLLVDL